MYISDPNFSVYGLKVLLGGNVSQIVHSALVFILCQKRVTF